MFEEAEAWLNVWKVVDELRGEGVQSMNGFSRPAKDTDIDLISEGMPL